MFKKGLAIIVCLGVLTSCNIFPLYKPTNGTTIRLAHNQSTDHPINTTLQNFANKVNKDENLFLEVYPNGQLGQERDVIEMVQAGVLDMAKVSAAALEAFNTNYKIFSVPYVFQSKEHYYNVMDNSESVKEIFNSTKDDGFFAITWFDAGQRSIYTKQDIEVSSTKALKGLKIRVQESPTAMKMIELMGGSPTPMSFGEVYTALQQNILDGAENNETALVTTKHGEVVKAYTYTEHQYAPDVLIVSTKKWNEYDETTKKEILEAAKSSTEEHKVIWKTAVENSVQEAEKMGVKFYRIDKTEFIEETQSMRDDFAKQNKRSKDYLDDFLSYIK